MVEINESTLSALAQAELSELLQKEFLAKRKEKPSSEREETDSLYLGKNFLPDYDTEEEEKADTLRTRMILNSKKLELEGKEKVESGELVLATTYAIDPCKFASSMEWRDQVSGEKVKENPFELDDLANNSVYFN
jgi:hypothetical protein